MSLKGRCIRLQSVVGQTPIETANACHGIWYCFLSSSHPPRPPTPHELTPSGLSGHRWHTIHSNKNREVRFLSVCVPVLNQIIIFDRNVIVLLLLCTVVQYSLYCNKFSTIPKKKCLVTC